MSSKHKALLRASLSTNSWNKHLSALHCFHEFQHTLHSTHTFPLSEKVTGDFIIFALYTKHLKHSTVAAYVNSLIYYQKLRNLDTSGCTSLLVKSLLQGAKNLNLYKEITASCRKAMTLPLLKILSHRIASESWPELNKQCFWTAFSVAFYGSFRFGELVSQSGRNYNSKETLLWSDIQFGKDFVVIHLKITKTKNPKGEYIDLFLQEDNVYCPVKALLRLKKLAKAQHNTPVFTLDDGSFLTPSLVNSTLLQLLTPAIGSSAKHITGHSFRAGLPSALASCPNLASSDDIRAWGRWSSDSYQLYVRLKSNQKRVIFNKIVSVLKV
jgi:hypothetical protein